VPLFTQRGGERQQLRVDGQVELDRAGDFDSLGPCTQAAKTLGLGFGLDGEQAHFRQHRRGQPGETPVALGRASRQPRVGQCHGNPAFGALVNMVGPQFGLHDHRQFRLHAIEKTLGRTGQIVRQVAVLDARLVGEQRLDALETGGRHAGDGDRQLWITFQQPANHRRSGDAFAHRHRMHPNPAGLHHRQAPGEAFSHALRVSRRFAGSQPQT